METSAKNIIGRFSKGVCVVRHIYNQKYPKWAFNLKADFVINKRYFINDFYSNHNTKKRTWFFKTFIKERHEITNCFYNFFTLHKVQILFFNWLESFYATEHHIAYPFAKHACPITSRSKTSIEVLANNTSIESEHPLLRNLKIPHNSQTIDAAPYKNLSDDITTNTKHII